MDTTSAIDQLTNSTARLDRSNSGRSVDSQLLSPELVSVDSFLTHLRKPLLKFSIVSSPRQQRVIHDACQGYAQQCLFFRVYSPNISEVSEVCEGSLKSPKDSRNPNFSFETCECILWPNNNL